MKPPQIKFNIFIILNRKYKKKRNHIRRQIPERQNINELYLNQRNENEKKGRK